MVMAQNSNGAEVEERVVLLPVAADKAVTEKVVDRYLEEARKPGDVVHVMHVLPLPVTEVGTLSSFPDGFYPLTLEPDSDETAIPEVASARNYIKRSVLSKLDEAKIPYKVDIVRYLTSSSSVGEAICCRADEIKAGLVIMAKNDHGILEKLLVGSVCNYCVKHCKHPLLLIH